MTNWAHENGALPQVCTHHVTWPHYDKYSGTLQNIWVLYLCTTVHTVRRYQTDWSKDFEILCTSLTRIRHSTCKDAAWSVPGKGETAAKSGNRFCRRLSTIPGMPNTHGVSAKNGWCGLLRNSLRWDRTKPILQVTVVTQWNTWDDKRSRVNAKTGWHGPCSEFF